MSLRLGGRKERAHRHDIDESGQAIQDIRARVLALTGQLQSELARLEDVLTTEFGEQERETSGR